MVYCCMTLNCKQSQEADKGWSTSLVIGQGASNPLLLKAVHHKMLHQASELWWPLVNIIMNLWIPYMAGNFFD